MGYFAALIGSLYMGYYYCVRLQPLKQRIIDLQKEINMAEKDLWDRIIKINDEITSIKVQIAKLETKMLFGTAIAALLSNGLFQLLLIYVKR
jgi:hypothetical protein